MVEQAKLLRVLQLIRLLRNERGRTLDQLAQALDCSTRTVRRYLDLLTEVGYLVDERVDRRGYFFLFEAEPEQAPLFSAEESALLQQALAGLEESNPLGVSLRQKLHRTTELIPLADELVDLQRGGLPAFTAGSVEATRKVTWVTTSRHMELPSRALDVAMLQADGSVSWPADALQKFSRLMLAANPAIRWGGDWDGNGQTADEKSPDFPHFEVPR